MADPIRRPAVPVVHADPAEHRRQLAMRANACLPKDGTERATAPLPLMSFEVADLPDPELWEGAIIYVPDETDGAVLAFSDGTNWLRVTDRSVVS